MNGTHLSEDIPLSSLCGRFLRWANCAVSSHASMIIQEHSVAHVMPAYSVELCRHLNQKRHSRQRLKNLPTLNSAHAYVFGYVDLSPVQASLCRCSVLVMCLMLYIPSAMRVVIMQPFDLPSQKVCRSACSSHICNPLPFCCAYSVTVLYVSHCALAIVACFITVVLYCERWYAFALC
ncbi:hypothetical protein BKA93DRAFT_779473 [Sparassis latifolia]